MAIISGRDTINGHRLNATFGAGRTRALAAVRAHDEFVERWSGFYRGDEATVVASYRDLGRAAVHPNDVMLFSDRQLRASKTRPFDERAALAWSPILSVSTGEWRYIPAQLVYYGHPRHRGFPLGSADSNGAAAGTSHADAALRGLLELVERDSVALWWYNKVQRPRVPLDDVAHPLARKLVRWFDALGRDVWALDLSSDLGIPVVVAVSAQRSAAKPRILMGFGANLDPARAVLRALVELAQEVAILTAADARLIRQPQADRDWLARGTIEAQPQLRGLTRMSHLGGATTSPRLGTRDALRRCTKLLEARGLEVLLVDQTREGAGRHVVKVFVPGLRPWWRRFAPGRLFDAPVAAGWRARPRAEHALNPLGIWF